MRLGRVKRLECSKLIEIASVAAAATFSGSSAVSSVGRERWGAVKTAAIGGAGALAAVAGISTTCAGALLLSSRTVAGIAGVA